MLRATLLGLVGLAASSTQAADGTYSNEASFAAAAGPLLSEGFEAIAPRARQPAAISTPGFSISAADTPIGVQASSDSPDPGNGAGATEGSRYLSVYLPDLPQGTLRFDLAAPATAFAFDLIDLGEAPGSLVLRTNTGAYAGGITLASFSDGGLLANGNVQFFGITQTSAFQTVYLSADGRDDAFGIDRVQLSAVPEPIQALLWSCGLAALLTARQRRVARRD